MYFIFEIFTYLDIMKSATRLIVYLCMILLTSTSCKTSEKFYIQSPIDASIYLPQQPSTEYDQIEKDNSVKIEVPSDSYIGYVILKDKQNCLDIPIGINIRHKSRTGAKVAAFGTGLIFFRCHFLLYFV